jgi:hypothetical protein
MASSHHLEFFAADSADTPIWKTRPRFVTAISNMARKGKNCFGRGNMHVSQNEPAGSLTGLETVPWAQEPESSEQRIFSPKSERELLASREGRRAFQRARAPNLPGFETEVLAQDLKSSEQQNFTTKPDSELLAANEFAHDGNPNPAVDRIEHVTEPDISTVPASGAVFHTHRSSRGGSSVAISVMLALIAGIGVGAWAFKSPLTSNAAAPQQIPQSAFANQLNVIAQDLSSLRQDLKELAARQEQLAAAQTRLVAAQEQTLLKLATVEQLKRGSPTRPASRAYR